MCKVFNTLHLNTWGSIYPNSKKYFLHMQSTQYFASKYLRVHIFNFEKILLARAKYSILCTRIPGDPYIQLRKNTSCTCKVFNTLHLNTWGPSIQLWKNTSYTCKVFNTLHLHTWGSIYPTSKNTPCTCKVFNTLHLNTWWSIDLTSKKYFLHVQSIQYFAPKYLGVHLSN